MPTFESPDFSEPIEVTFRQDVYITEEVTPDGIVVTLDTGGQIEKTPPLSREVALAFKHGVWRQPEGGMR